jgi:hypothetical protein
MTKMASECLRECRKRVHDDAFEAQVAAHLAAPLLSGSLNKLKGDQRPVGIFLRRVLFRYVAMGLSRLLEAPGTGRTGVTASIASLLHMGKREGILDKRQIQHFTSEFEKIKSRPDREDLVKSLRALRTSAAKLAAIPAGESPANRRVQSLL